MSIIKKISIPGFLPPATSFGDNEIIINTIDGKLYIKNTQNNTLRVINQDSDKNTFLDGDVLINKKIEFKLTKDSNSILFISSSGGSGSRVGIGTTDPKSTIDFKSVDNSSIGTELILRSARSSITGALSGDEGGSINFTIDSGSFTDLKTSGSLAKIKTIVSSVGAGGAEGTLAFTISKGVGAEGRDVFKYGYAIGGEGATFAQLQTGSLIITDFGALAPSKIKMIDYDGTINFQAFEGDITASGDISASGTIHGVTGSFLLIDGGTF